MHQFLRPISVTAKRADARACRALLLCSAMLLPAGAAWAQQEGEQAKVDGIGSEIVVTATRRAAVLQDVPLAIDAVSGDNIAEAQAYSFESFARLNPSLQVNNRGVGDNQIILRGISSAGKPTVGLYFDETIVTGLGLDGGSDNQPNIQLHDIERVEILKGPQGTLFGASSMSGTVRIITRKPNLKRPEMGFSVSGASVDGGNGLYQAEAFVDLPIVEDKVGLRAVGWVDNGGGYIDRNGPFPETNVNDQHVRGARATLLVKPSSALTLTFSALHQESKADGAQYFELDQGAYNTSAPTTETFADNIDIYSAVADLDVGIGTVTASTSYFSRDLLLRRDSTATARRFGIPANLAYNQGQNLKNWSNELRFASDFSGPFQIVAGGFYAEQRSDSANAALVANSLGRAPCDFAYDCRAAGLATADVNSAYGNSDIDQYALFAEGALDLTSKLTATVGIRYYEANIHERTVSTQRLRFPTSPVQTVDEVTLDEKTKENKISYNFALSYELTPETTFYARVASGFRPGGTNNADAAAQQGITVPDRYQSDNLWNYEVGAKTWLFDRMIYAELGLFYIDWSKQQISVTDQGGTFVYIANAGRSNVKGAELSITARPATGLTMNIGATYTNSRLAEDLPATAETPAFDGDRLPYTPRWSAAAQISYEAPFTDSLSGYASVNANYRGSSYTGFNALDDNYARLDDYTLVNARLGVRTGPLDLGLFVDNVFNDAPQIGLRVNGDGYRVYTARPRTIGVRLTGNF